MPPQTGPLSRAVPKLDPDRLAQLVPPMLPSSPAEFRFQRPPEVLHARKTSHKRCRMPCQGAALLRGELAKPRGNPADLPVAWRRQALQRPASSGAASRGRRDSEGRPLRPDRPRRSAGYRRMSQRLATVKEIPTETQQGRRAPETRTFALWELYKLAREENLSVEEVVRMKQLFDDFDEDHGGTLDIGEFENVALRLLATQLGNTTQARERARKLCEGNFKLMDSDGSGEVDFHEFLRWYSSRCFSESLLLSDSEREIRELAKTYGLDVHIVDKAKEYFDAADTDGSGHIQFEEFAVVLPKMLKLPEGSELPASRIRFFWMEADVNRDKNIAFTEFLSWWLKHLTNETNMSDFLHIQNPEIMVNFYRSMRPEQESPQMEPVHPSASMMTDRSFFLL
ncbi:Caltractin ICL1a [Symbiodinium microadriaticum]|uniref:Caltractin ICL1a n=1 Tax=Symbiodinium microadriaticum TaxID=2951 RepID=A0A1Q9CPZ4_SYMMI|nr:Caltractin ICL1a [Symbiodinium microadriaticum]